MASATLNSPDNALPVRQPGELPANRRYLSRITKRVVFSAAHHYWKPDWEAPRNEQAFGASANRWGHGHNYDLEVTVAGALDPETSMVINLYEVKRILNERIVDYLGQRHLNYQIPFFQRVQPTLETMAVLCWERLAPAFAERGFTLHRISLRENEELGLDYFGGMSLDQCGLGGLTAGQLAELLEAPPQDTFTPPGDSIAL